jgi:hypothetical protein
MKVERVVAWLSLGAPLLIVLAVVAAQQREAMTGFRRCRQLPVGSASHAELCPRSPPAAAPGCMQI